MLNAGGGVGTNRRTTSSTVSTAIALNTSVTSRCNGSRRTTYPPSALAKTSTKSASMNKVSTGATAPSAALTVQHQSALNGHFAPTPPPLPSADDLSSARNVRNGEGSTRCIDVDTLCGASPLPSLRGSLWTDGPG